MWNPCTFTVWVEDVDDAGPPRIVSPPRVRGRSAASQRYQYQIVRVPLRDSPYVQAKKPIPPTPTPVVNTAPVPQQPKQPEPAPQQKPPAPKPANTHNRKQCASKQHPRARNNACPLNAPKPRKPKQDSPPLKSCLKQDVKKVRFADHSLKMNTPHTAATVAMSSNMGDDSWESASDSGSNTDDYLDTIPFCIGLQTTSAPPSSNIDGITRPGELSNAFPNRRTNLSRINTNTQQPVRGRWPRRRVNSPPPPAPPSPTPPPYFTNAEPNSDNESNMDDSDNFQRRFTRLRPASSGIPTVPSVPSTHGILRRPPTLDDVRRANATYGRVKYVPVFRSTKPITRKRMKEAKHVRFVLPSRDWRTTPNNNSGGSGGPVSEPSQARSERSTASENGGRRVPATPVPAYHEDSTEEETGFW